MCFISSQYYHSVRVFAGQDPASVWVGWVTPDYHYYSKNFNLGKTRTVTVTLGDERGRVHERQAALQIQNIEWLSFLCKWIKTSSSRYIYLFKK